MPIEVVGCTRVTMCRLDKVTEVVLILSVLKRHVSGMNVSIDILNSESLVNVFQQNTLNTSMFLVHTARHYLRRSFR